MKHVIIQSIYDSSHGLIREDDHLCYIRDSSIYALVTDGTSQYGVPPDYQRFHEAITLHEKDSTPGRFVSRITTNTIAAFIAQEPQPDLRNALLAANREIRARLSIAYPNWEDAKLLEGILVDGVQLKHHPAMIRLMLPAACATLVRVHTDKNQLAIAHVGDTVLVARHKDGSIRELVPDQVMMSEAQRLAVGAEIKAALGLPHFADVFATEQYISDSIRHHLLFNCVGENGRRTCDWGIGILNGLPEIEHYIYCSVESLSDIDAVLVASDGFLLPAPLHETTEMRQVRLKDMFQHIGEHGMVAYVEYLRSIEANDMHLDKYPRFKIHDDATAILLQIVDC